MLGLSGDSPSILHLRHMLDAAARSNASVLIQGETGSGKEVICKELHRRSNRAGKPLVALNCAAIPPALLESELFGYRKGAYTGALTDRKGRLEMAQGGTLFLDEIGDMPQELQAKLLRFLEERLVDPLGNQGAPIPVDVRIVAATHKNLEDLAQKGQFREDLYFRLNVIPIQVPPLRDRQEQFLEFLEHFTTEQARGEQPLQFTTQSLEVLKSYNWPGNLRELSNFIMRLTVLYPGRVINLAQVPPGLLSSGMEAIIRSQSIQEVPGSSGEIPTPSARDSSLLEYFDFTADSPGDQPIGAMRLLEATFDDLENRAFFPEGGLHCKSLVERFEIALLKAALREAKQNTKAAKLLCMERTTFIQKLSRYGVDKSGI